MEKTKKRILSVGEIIWDVYDRAECIGGAPLNFAAHCARLGTDSTLLSAVGRDDLGERAVTALSSFGVSTQYIQMDSHSTGRCIVTLDEGIPRYDVVKDVAYDWIRFPVEITRERFDALYFGTLIQRGESRNAIKEILKSGGYPIVLCDLNLREGCYDNESAFLCLSNATILKISEEEEPLLRCMGLYSAESSSSLDVAVGIANAYKNISTVVVTMGKKGAIAYDAETKKHYYQPSVGEKVISTVGAGDSFCAAFLISVLNGETTETALRMGAILSGYVVAHRDAVPDYDRNTLYKNDILW